MKSVGKSDKLYAGDVGGVSVNQKIMGLFPAFQGPRSRTLRTASYLRVVVLFLSFEHSLFFGVMYSYSTLTSSSAVAL